MDDWKRSFVTRLGDVKSRWSQKFEEALDNNVSPVFGELDSFLQNHDFALSQPMKEDGRRSFKFELAENAYLLMIFRSTGLGTFELRSECCLPGHEENGKVEFRVDDVNKAWANKVFQAALDSFIELLSNNARDANGGDSPGPSEVESFEELLSV